MAPLKSIIFVLILNLCVVLCASLPWTYKQNGETGTLYDKLFPSEVRSIQDSYDKYPWRRNEATGPLLSVGKSQDENTASKFQTEQSLRKREMESKLLHELLDWEKRRLEKATLSDVTNEKREPQRCYGGQMGGCGKRRRVFNNAMKVMDTEAGPSLMDDKDIDTIKKYDMAVDKALRELEVEIPGM